MAPAPILRCSCETLALGLLGFEDGGGGDGGGGTGWAGPWRDGS